MSDSGVLKGANDMEKLKELATRTFKAQAIWFLNSFWDEVGQKESEKVWEYVGKIAKLDLQKGAGGNEVDELQMHRFLEFFQETMTVREMRDSLRSKGAIGDLVKMVPLVHYLIFRYNVDFHVLVNASQGDNRAEIEEAQRKLDAVSEAYAEAEAKAHAAKTALAEAKAREAAAKKSEADAKAAEVEAKAREAESKSKAEMSKVKETEARAAQVELEAALAEVKAQEDSFNAKTADLKRKSEEGTVVAQNKAKNELAQHLASDSLPLRKAKITQEAAVKKAEKASKAAADARVAAENAAVEATKATKAAEKARQDSERATREAEAAVEAMQVKVDEAEAFLNYVKSKPGKAAGAIWWMERELHEKKKYLPFRKILLPERKGGITK